MKVRRLVLALGILAWSAAAFGAGFGVRAWLSPVEVRVERVYGADHAHPLLDEAWRIVETHALEELPPASKREYAAIRGLLSSLNDSHAQFNEPAQDQIARSHLRGIVGGIGVRFALDESGHIVLTPLRDSPAERAGIRPGDILLSIDNRLLPSPARLEDAIGLQGEPGTVVLIAVRRGGQRLQFRVTREQIRIPSVEWELIGETAQLGWVRVRQFSEQTADELQHALQSINQRNVRAYILDLRDNSGGLLSSAVDVASQFIIAGEIAIEQQRGQADQVFMVNPAERRLGLDKPMVVLINENTASAAEIVASAIQHHRRGRLVGTRTFGKGSVQRLFALRDGSSLRITTSRWLTAGRRTLEDQGLQPDVWVQGADEQMQTAVRLLTEMSAHAQ